MPAHCANNVNPDVAARRRSCAADIETVGVSENGVLDYGGAGSIHTRTPPKVSFADDGDIIGTSESAVRHVSFARDIEIICESLGKDEGNDNKTDKPIDGPRKVSFVDDVEIIGQSEHYDSVYTEVEALDFNADGLFEADGFFFTTHEIGNNLSNVVVNGIGETLTGDEYAHFATDENYSPAPRLLSPPPRHSSINWRRNVSYQHLRPVDMAPPTMGRLLQPDRTPPSVTLSPLALPPPLIPLDGVEPLVISPPPAYVTGDDEILETEIEDTAIMALRSPVPTYNDDIRPPEYSVDAYSVRDVDDIVLEEVFSDVGLSRMITRLVRRHEGLWLEIQHISKTAPTTDRSAETAELHVVDGDTGSIETDRPVDNVFNNFQQQGQAMNINQPPAATGPKKPASSRLDVAKRGLNIVGKGLVMSALAPVFVAGGLGYFAYKGGEKTCHAAIPSLKHKAVCQKAQANSEAKKLLTELTPGESLSNQGENNVYIHHNYGDGEAYARKLEFRQNYSVVESRGVMSAGEKVGSWFNGIPDPKDMLDPNLALPEMPRDPEEKEYVSTATESGERLD